jgi:hypothetical protein
MKLLSSWLFRSVRIIEMPDPWNLPRTGVAMSRSWSGVVSILPAESFQRKKAWLGLHDCASNFPWMSANEQGND